MQLDLTEVYMNEKIDPRLSKVRIFFADENYLTAIHGSMDLYRIWIAGMRKQITEIAAGIIKQSPIEAPPGILFLVHKPGTDPRFLKYFSVELREHMETVQEKQKIPLYLRFVLEGTKVKFAKGAKIVGTVMFSEATMTKVVVVDGKNVMGEKINIMLAEVNYLTTAEIHQWDICRAGEGRRELIRSEKSFSDSIKADPRGLMSCLFYKTAGMRTPG